MDSSLEYPFYETRVTTPEKVPENALDVLQGGKRTIALNMKDARAKALVLRMVRQYDVVLEAYRPGVMERLGLGPDTLLAANPALIYARLSGFGQTGPLSQRAGHDINYAAVSGVLSMLGRKGEKPFPPINLVADFAGGGLLCAFGILAAIASRNRTGQGQVVDCSMTEGAAYVASWLTRSRGMPIWMGGERGENLLDGGRFFYDTYATKDGLFMSVGCLEAQFFAVLVEKLGLDGAEFTQYMDNEEGKRVLEEIFRTRTQQEWSAIFEDTDACVYPVVDWTKAPEHRQHKARGQFVRDGDTIVPQPAPKLSGTPCESAGIRGSEGVDPWKDVQDIMKEVGVDEKEIQELIDAQVVITVGKPKL